MVHEIAMTWVSIQTEKIRHPANRGLFYGSDPESWSTTSQSDATICDTNVATRADLGVVVAVAVAADVGSSSSACFGCFYLSCCSYMA